MVRGGGDNNCKKKCYLGKHSQDNIGYAFLQRK